MTGTPRSPSGPPSASSEPSNVFAAQAFKTQLRRALLAGRARRPLSQRTAVGIALAQVFSGAFGDRLSPGNIVATYVSIGGEPGMGPLFEVLAGTTVLVPVLLPNRDLDWTAADAPETRLGVDAIADASLVLVPALALDRSGHRLGRGGGSYDRALARVRPEQTVLGVVHDDEVLDALPVEPHDRSVSGALTPSGVLWFSTPGHG
jgi:5-formyltetrahydrofolate cyclo-ligase